MRGSSVADGVIAIGALVFLLFAVVVLPIVGIAANVKFMRYTDYMGKQIQRLNGCVTSMNNLAGAASRHEQMDYAKGFEAIEAEAKSVYRNIQGYEKKNVPKAMRRFHAYAVQKSDNGAAYFGAMRSCSANGDSDLFWSTEEQWARDVVALAVQFGYDSALNVLQVTLEQIVGSVVK